MIRRIILQFSIRSIIVTDSLFYEKRLSATFYQLTFSGRYMFGPRGRYLQDLRRSGAEVYRP